MVCKLEDEQSVETPEEPAPNETENSIRNTIYSVGIDQMPNLKERIAKVHGANSEVMKGGKEMNRAMHAAIEREFAEDADDIVSAIKQFLFYFFDIRHD